MFGAGIHYCVCYVDWWWSDKLDSIHSKCYGYFFAWAIAPTVEDVIGHRSKFTVSFWLTGDVCAWIDSNQPCGPGRSVDSMRWMNESVI